MTGQEKIGPEHRDRRAFVYVRQSTPAQVMQHRTSTERQIGLGDRAQELGWAPTTIDVVTDDLGCSGRFSEGRVGFQRLAGEMSLGNVGAVFSLDASRLARSSADWHRLVEIAAITKTLLIDEQSVYDPRDPNDRLLLGMKGTMADFEMVFLRSRMEGGRWHLAAQGDYRFRPPAGYVHEGDESAALVKDPDDEIRRAIELVFERYRLAGTGSDVLRYFAENKLRFPARYGKRLEWTRLNHSRLNAILANPIYAGAYVFGRMRAETYLDGSARRRRVRSVPMSDWRVKIHDHHPAYISWEEYLANQKRMTENGARRAGSQVKGAARQGRALLQGLLLCGRCGARLNVRYSGQNGRRANYDCNKLVSEGFIDQHCLYIGARTLDEPIVEIVLGLLKRDGIADAIRAVELVGEQDEALERQWQLRLERARYEAKRAERQYDACDPDNRTVARTLEKRWNDRLVEVETLEREHLDSKSRLRLELSEVERQRMLQLARDVPRLWRARTTSDRDRKLLLRHLIKDVGVRAIDVPRAVLRAQILWHTGAVTDLEIEPLGRGAPKTQPVRYQVLQTRVPEARQATSSP
jgi:DNA invertase Pin-like site-specific DNA recombinase